ncbi:acyl-CoA dehydrogenase family protein, partial [Mycobacterium kansasii]
QLASGHAIGCFGLTEPDFGSNPGGMRTRARRDGKDWILDGTKMWITNGNLADVATVWAQTDDGVRGFVVPTATKGFAANVI